MPLITDEVLRLAQILWDYHHVHHDLVSADCIFVLGSNDLRVAERGAQLYLEGYAPLLTFSGGLGRLTSGTWTESEAARFAAVAKKMGVPDEAILIEDMSTNTGENIRFTKELLQSKGIKARSFILVQKPYMERRTFATFKKQWPGMEFCVTSPQISFADYPTEMIPMETVLNVMVGDLQRIIEYPAKGFQVYQEVPGDVLDAFNKLVALGFDKQLIVK